MEINNILNSIFNLNSLLFFGPAFLMSFCFIPVLIKMAFKFKWVDQPNERKVHVNAIPTLGGIAIVVAMVLSLLMVHFFFFPINTIWLIGIALFLMAIGLTDDLLDISAKLRLVIQLSLGLIIAWQGIRIESLYGLFGIHDLPMMLQYLLTAFFLTGFINAFNFIDGIDGLAGGIGLINTLVLGGTFMYLGSNEFALWSLALAGGIAAFLYYNFNPAKIFMGDTGSTVLGLLIGVLGIKLIQLGDASPHLLSNAHIFVAGIIILVFFDIGRTLFFRVMKGNSPFSPDKTHIHHLLLKTRFNHKKAALILIFSNIVLIIISFLIKDYVQTGRAVFVLLISCILLTELLSLRKIYNINLQFRNFRSDFKELKKSNRFIDRGIEA